jgi:hypothetical protein
VCGERKRRKLQSAMLLGLPPVLALPGSVWRQVIELAADGSADGSEVRAQILRRAEPFSRSGFPVLVDPPNLGRVMRSPLAAVRAPARPVLTAMIAAAAVAVIATGTVVVTNSPRGGGEQALAPGPTLGSQPAKPLPAQQSAPAVNHSQPPATRPTVSVAAQIGAKRAPIPTLAPPPATGAAGTPPAAAGTLTESPATVTLRRARRHGAPIGWFTLTANDGPVAFAVTVPAEHADDLTVTPATGSLAAGQSVQVLVTLRRTYDRPLRTELGVQPGDLAVTVIYRVRPG